MNLLAYFIAAAMAFAGGWMTNGWRLDGTIQEIKAEHTQAILDAQKASDKKLAEMTAERDAIASRLVVIDQEATAKLTKARNENQALSARLAAGTVGLRIAATCPAGDPGHPESAEGAGVGAGAGATLAADARFAYSALRDGIAATEQKLSACQRMLAEFSFQSPRP